MFPKLEAVVEFNPPENFSAWETVNIDHSVFLRLWAETSFEETGSIIAQIASYNGIEASPTDKEIIQSIINAECLVVGGIQAVNEELKTIPPGCCCGLEEWTEWLLVNEEQQSLWLGHDPAPWIQYLRNEKVMRVWSNGANVESLNDPPANLFHIDFTFGTFQESLIRVQKDLNDFLLVLHKWTRQIDESSAEDLVTKFRQDFNIKPYK